jgi:hypothetical protein
LIVSICPRDHLCAVAGVDGFIHIAVKDDGWYDPRASAGTTYTFDACFAAHGGEGGWQITR